MAYKPTMIERNSLKGNATIKVGTKNGQKLFGVTFEDKPNVVYPVSAKNAPDYVVAGEFYVKMSDDKTKILSTSPQKGKFSVVVDSFPAKEGEKPTPYTVVNQKYNNSTQKFNVLLKIVSEKYNGMPILLALPYFWFDVDEQNIDGTMRQVVGLKLPKRPSPGFKLLMAFLSASGAWKFGAIPWSDNILPALAKRILRASEQFDVRLENGFVDTIDYDDEDEDWQKEKETSKSSKKEEPKEDVTDWGEPDEDTTTDETSDDVPWEDVDED